MALAFNGGGVNVALGLVHYGDIERFRELERGGAGYLNSNNDVFSQQVGPVRRLRNCLNSLGPEREETRVRTKWWGSFIVDLAIIPLISVYGLGTNCSPVFPLFTFSFPIRFPAVII